MSTKQTPTLQKRASPLPAWFDGQGPDAEVVISTRIRVARNLASHRFPRHAPPRERTVIYGKVAEALGSQPQFKSWNVVNFSGITPLERQLLVENRAASADLLCVEGDRGVAFDRSHRVNIMINEEDHLRLQCLDSGCRPFELWSIVDMIDERLGQRLDFAYDCRQGFLTANPVNAGTGLRVSFLMHLPGLVLTKSVDAVLQGASQMGIAARGFFGEHAEVVGNFFQLSNQATLGSQEGEFIESTHRIAAEVARHEREARQRLLREARLELTDRIFRAYGIIQHARTLSFAEFLNLASALRLGCDCGILPDMSLDAISHATLSSMPAHLQKIEGKCMNERELSVARAERVRTILLQKRRKKVLKS